jgi:hypothetical protein
MPGECSVSFLKKLFGGQAGRSDSDGIYVYIRSNATGEVIRVRLHRYNDLTASDDFTSYHVNKTIMGAKSFDRIEAEFEFDKNRRLVSGNITGGTLVDEDAYETYLAQKAVE